MPSTDLAVVGAGPYGLSLAAHLASRKADFRIFGSPMRTWLEQMPKGMHLKSDGFASSLSAPEPAHTLQAYCQERGLAYHDTDVPVQLQTFTDYALDFARRFAPAVEDTMVEQIEAAGTGFRLRLSTGESLSARKVVVAVGISYFDYIPEPMIGLPGELATHSSAHHELAGFCGREVTVLGAGSSAVDLAVLLHEAGASVRMATRGDGPRFGRSPNPGRSGALDRLRHPRSGLGVGWKNRACADAPTLFRRLPPSMRLNITRKHLGPMSPERMKDRLFGKLPVHPNHLLTRAQARGGRVRLDFSTAGGGRATIESDHVIAATGYRADLRRLPFLGEALRTQIRAIEHTPVLSSHFESSVHGLYFLGPVAASSFGPLMRFMFGTSFAARRLGASLARASR